MSAAVQTTSSSPALNSSSRRSEEQPRQPTSARVVVPVVGSGTRESSPPPAKPSPPASVGAVAPRSQSSVSSDSTSSSTGVGSSDRDEQSQASSSTEEEPRSAASNAEPEFMNMETFRQILELDDEDDDEFSRGMADAYFSQAEDTFKKMDEAYKEQNLAELSSLGHFLKGSSAALGVCKVQACCERVQHYGQLRDEELGVDLDSKEALDKISKQLGQVKKYHKEARLWLESYFGVAKD